MASIKIEGGGLTATCETAEQAAALWRLLESQVSRAPAATSLADEPAPKRRSPRRAPEPQQSNGATEKAFAQAAGGRKPSAFTLAVYDALRSDPEPDFEKLAKAHGVEAKAARAVLQRGVATGRLKKLAGGGHKVVG